MERSVEAGWLARLNLEAGGFTLMMEALMMLLSAEMPVDALADLLDGHDTRLWRVLMHCVEQAHAKSDWSALRRIAVDETSARARATLRDQCAGCRELTFASSWSRDVAQRPSEPSLPDRGDCHGYEPSLCEGSYDAGQVDGRPTLDLEASNWRKRTDPGGTEPVSSIWLSLLVRQFCDMPHWHL